MEVSKALFYCILCWITILSLITPLISQTVWFENAKDFVDGRFSQGVATDGVNWYFSARQKLFKTNSNFGFLIVQENPIPEFLRDQGYDHIGDIAYFEGKLYAPVEDVSYVKPVIVLYDADSLNFTGEYAQVPQSHFPWIAVDPRTGDFYSSEFNGVNKLFVYDPDQNFALIDEVQLDVTLFRVQGGAFLGDFLYLACDNGDSVYTVDIASGRVKYIISVPSGPEMEGIEAYKLDSGDLHFLAETGAEKNVFYHYATEMATGVKWTRDPERGRGFSLSQSYPNPFDLSKKSRFRPETIIEYTIYVPGKVTMEIYNVLGQSVRTFVRENLEPGIHKMLWDGKDKLGRNLPSGAYIYRIESGNFVQSRKLVLLR